MEELVAEVNEKIEEGYYVYHGVQHSAGGYAQAVVMLPERYGEEMWRIFHSVDDLFVSTALEKETALANDAVPLVLERLRVAEGGAEGGAA